MPARTRSVLWQYGPMVYLPTAIFALGEGAVLPLVPVIASGLGADIATAALISAALVVGQLCGNIPAGMLVARVGERATMLLAGALALLGAIACAFAPQLALLAAAMFVIGFSAAAFALARHAFMTTRVPLAYRARALALLGGTFRFGMFLGPFTAAALLGVFGSPTAALWFFCVCLCALLVLVFFGADPEKSTTAPDPTLAEDSGEAVTGSITLPEKAGVLRTIWLQRRVLSRLGLSAACLSSVRAARQVALPLWGVSLGLDPSTIALVVGVSGAIDFALFYASGQVMDRFGRLWAALPSLLLMGGGFLALSLTHELDQAVLWFGMMAAVIGVGNGLSSGILLTLGADLAPPGEPAAFLGSWRTITEAGAASAPLIVSGVAAAASLPLAIAIVGAIGLLGAGGMLRWIPRLAPGTPRR